MTTPNFTGRNVSIVEIAKMTFSEVYEKWSSEKFPTISASNIKGYQASYKSCQALHNRVFKELKLIDLQDVIDTCGKNYPTLRKIKVLLNQVYSYAMKYELCSKDYSQYVNILKFKDKNPNKTDCAPFTEKEINALWMQADNIYVQIVLMLIYSGVRVSELLDLKRKNVFIDEHYFEVVKARRTVALERFQYMTEPILFLKSGMTKDVNTCFIRRRESTLHIATTMIPTGHLLWS